METNIKKIEIKPNQYVWVDKSQQASITLFYGKEPITYSGKLIAASSELNLDVPTYVEWLAYNHASQKLKRPITIYKHLQQNVAEYVSFTEGYQTAEKKLFTEEEVRKAIELSKKCSVKSDGVYFSYTENEIIEQLKKDKNERLQ